MLDDNINKNHLCKRKMNRRYLKWILAVLLVAAVFFVVWVGFPTLIGRLGMKERVAGGYSSSEIETLENIFQVEISDFSQILELRAGIFRDQTAQMWLALQNPSENFKIGAEYRVIQKASGHDRNGNLIHGTGYSWQDLNSGHCRTVILYWENDQCYAYCYVDQLTSEEMDHFAVLF